MDYLVTGGAGFIGSNLVKRLVKEGHKVTVIDDLSTGKRENLIDDVVFYEKNICDNLSDIFKNRFDAVFHLAALPRVQFSIKEPVKTNNANINGTLNLLNFCRNFKVKRFVFSSSSSVYGDQEELPLNEGMIANPLSPYALQKLVGEVYCKLFNSLYGLETVGLRYFNVYGPGQDPEGDYAGLIPKFIRLINESVSPVIYGDGEQTRDFSFVSDVVEANILAANVESGFGEVFNVGGGNNVSVNGVTKLILKFSGKNVDVIHGEPVVEARHSLADVGKSKRILSWEPKVKFEDGLKKTYEYFTNQNINSL